MQIQSNTNDETINKPSTNPSAEESQISNKMELIKPPTDMIALFLENLKKMKNLKIYNEKNFRDLDSGFAVVR